MKRKILAGLLLAGSTMFAAPRIAFGAGFGAPVVAPPMVAAAPPCPGPGYLFVDGGKAIGARQSISNILTGTPNIFAANGGRVKRPADTRGFRLRALARD